jgi:hypothetical protein
MDFSAKALCRAEHMASGSTLTRSGSAAHRKLSDFSNQV